MNKVLINPENYKSKYINYVNQCFANWGNEIQYNWAFERKIGQHPSDIIVLTNENDEVIAGSGLSFRKIKTNKKQSVEIAIFTGSWTLPNARGRGCFTQIIEIFEQICRDKNIPFLTAFVTESNGSYRRFKDLNYYCLEANNILSNDFPFENVPDFEIEMYHSNFPVDCYQIYCANAVNKTTFDYTESEFNGQYINRTNATSVVKIEENHFLVEENDTTFRLLYIQDFNLKHIQGLANHVLKTKGKKTMFFLTDIDKSNACQAQNFNVVKGFFTVTNVNNDQSMVADIFSQLVINLADKM